MSSKKLLKTNLIFLGILTVIFSLASCNNGTNKQQSNSKKDSLSITVEIDKRFDIEVEPYNIIEDIVQPNQPFSLILKKHKIPYNKVIGSIEASKGILDLRYIQQGNRYYIFKRKDSTQYTDYLVYKINSTQYVKFNFIDSVEVSSHKLKIEIDTAYANGKIESSLWLSMKKANIDPILALELSDIYAWSIDFYGLQEGDSFSLVYERKHIDTNYIGIGKILCSSFIHSGHNYTAYLYTQDSLEDYFDDEGGSLRRAFLKSPLKYGRVSSRFSNSRLHPILKIRRPHHGVDYSAARGTPVHTIGDGKVIYAARKGGYGKRVEIKHNGTYTTGYAHLYKYAKGLKKGDFVKQGTVIGYVGSTGMSTGPHLDFRVYKNGKPIDPLKMKSPPAIPIKDDNKEDYATKINYYKNLIKGFK